MKRLSIFILILGVAAATPVASAATSASGNSAAVSSPMIAARSQITAIIAKPALMTSVMKTLSAKEQLAFVAEVNAAIAAMNGSETEKAVLFLNVNRAALDGAVKGNLTAVVAEIYATVPVYALTVINESFAANVFNRAANPKVTYTDRQFIQISQNVLKAIGERLKTVPDSGVRNGFAALMMIRASNTATEEVKAAIIASLPAAVQETAKNEWFPAALAEGEAQSYETMLGMTEEVIAKQQLEIRDINVQHILRIAGVQDNEAMLGDLSGYNTDMKLDSFDTQPIIDAVYNPIGNELPKLSPGDGFSDVAAQIGEIQRQQEEEPGPYQGQNTGN